MYDIRRKMRNRCFILGVLLSLACVTMNAQEEHLVPSKEAKKEAKVLSKEGWQTMESVMPMEEQIEYGFLLQNALMEDEDGETVSRYIVASAEGTDSKLEMAKMKARVACEAIITQSLQASIRALIDRKTKTRQHSATEAETDETTSKHSEAASRANLKNCVVVRHLKKKNGDGTFSVQLVLALDKKSL